MIDIRDANAMVTRLRGAQLRFERGAPVPRPARELLNELGEALADSGPLELDVTADKWLKAVRAAARGVETGDANPSSKTVRRTQHSLRELELFFARKDPWWLNLIGSVCGIVGLLIPVAIVVGSHDKLRALMWTAIVIGGLTLLGCLDEIYARRYKPSTRAASRWLNLPDRQLFALVVSADSIDRARPQGSPLYVHPVLLATDRRLVLARAAHAAPGSTGRHEFEFGWQILYSDITALSSKTTGGDNPKQVVTVKSHTREISYKLEPADGKALAAILTHRAPEASTESAASAPTEPMDAEPTDVGASQRQVSTGWMWLCLLPFGFGAWVPLTAGRRANKRSWQWIGAVTCVIALAGWVLAPHTHDRSLDARDVVTTAAWIIGCIATAKIHRPYIDAIHARTSTAVTTRRPLPDRPLSVREDQTRGREQSRDERRPRPAP